MTLRHLRIFTTVYETGGTTAAAEKLHIAQPSVSLAISEMEKYYGVRFFDRISRRLMVTDAGRRLYDYAKHIISLFDEMETEMLSQNAAGTVRVGSTMTIGSTILPDVLYRMKNEHPDISVISTINKIAVLMELLKKNSIDIALLETIPHDPSLIEIPFYNDHMCIICSPHDPHAGRTDLDAKVLEEKDFFFRDKGSAGRDIVDSILLLNDLNVKSTMESASPQAIVKSVALGLGYSILPYPLIKDDLASGTIAEFSVKGMELKRTFSIVYHKNKYLTKSAASFIANIQNYSR